MIYYGIILMVQFDGCCYMLHVYPSNCIIMCVILYFNFIHLTLSFIWTCY